MGEKSGITNIFAIFPEQEYVIAVLTNLGSYENYLDLLLKIVTNFASI